MCGLYGCLTNTLSGSEKENVFRLALMNTTRGIDSTGAAFLWKHKGKVKKRVVKQNVDAFRFFADGEVRTHMSINSLFCIIGHNRAATLGKVNQQNAHPFEEGHIIGAHNGTIDKYKPDKDQEEFMTDSRKLFQNMNEMGELEALRDVGDGAFAVTYMNAENNTFNIARNDKRPLYGLWNKAHTTLYWASERWMLEVVERFDFTNTHSPFMFETNKVLSFDLKSLKEREAREINRPLAPMYSRTTVGNHAQGAPGSAIGARVPVLGPNTEGRFKAEQERRRATTDGQQLPSLPSSRGSVPPTGHVTYNHTLSDFDKLPDKFVVISPKSWATAHKIIYRKLGVTDFYNKEGELIRRIVDDPKVWRERKGNLQEQQEYKGYKNIIYPLSLISSIFEHGECSLCSCKCNERDDVWFHASDEFLCVDCKKREGEHMFHHTQLYKGELME